jgi:hypothetical protein
VCVCVRYGRFTLLLNFSNDREAPQRRLRQQSEWSDVRDPLTVARHRLLILFYFLLKKYYKEVGYYIRREYEYARATECVNNAGMKNDERGKEKETRV